MKLFLQNPSTCEHSNINCDPWDLISNLKAKIQEKENISIMDQYLLYKCKPLLDSKSLDSYGIQNQDTLFLQLRIRGGMKTQTQNNREEIIRNKKKSKHLSFGAYSLNKRDLLPNGYKNVEDLQDTYQRQKKDIDQQNLLHCEYKHDSIHK